MDKGGKGSFSGSVKMLCGTTKTRGYHHIQFGHVKGWVKLVTWDGRFSASDWDVTMLKATRATLGAPKVIYARPGSKLCYAGKITSYRTKNGKVVAQKTWNHAVVVSKNAKRVITSYPGKC